MRPPFRPARLQGYPCAASYPIGTVHRTDTKRRKGTMHTDLSAAIRTLRGVRSQREFADELGVTRQSIIYWEDGRRIPHPRHARALVAAGLDPDVWMRATMSGDAA